jgi:hypothetical protein
MISERNFKELEDRVGNRKQLQVVLQDLEKKPKSDKTIDKINKLKVEIKKMSLYERLVAEMPYVDDCEGNIFDLEAEKFQKDYHGLVKKVKSILNGEKNTDKYGNTIELDGTNRIEWARELQKTIDVDSMLRKKFKKSWRQFWQDCGLGIQ